MQKASFEELAKIPYLDRSVVGERSLLLMPLWEDAKWHQWVIIEDGKLLQIQVVDAARSNYVAKVPAKEGDLCIPLVEFLWQHANWPEVSRLILSLCEDFHLLGTSAAKLRHLFVTRESANSLLVGSFVQTELEYLLTVSRSVFDLFQEIIATLWNGRIRLLDPAAEKKRRQRKLPTTFSDVVLKAEVVRTPEEIIDRFGLPEPMAKQIVQQARLFTYVRKWRDRIVHGGSSVDIVFVTDSGFCVSPTHKAFQDFNWQAGHHFNEAIVSLLPWVAHIVWETIEACTQLMMSFAQCVAFPPPCAPGYRVFLRDPVNEELIRLLDALNGSNVWWGEPPQKSTPSA